MQNIDILYNLFALWVQAGHEEYIHENPTAAFLNIDITGQGFVGDDTGAIYVEFDTVRDGITQLATGEKGEKDNVKDHTHRESLRGPGRR